MAALEGLRLDQHGCFLDRPDAVATFTGGRIEPLHPRQEDIHIEDIARGLANGCRWNGQCRFYSVAEHSVLVSYIVPTLEALMHDASEAYLTDMARPVKTRSPLGELYLKYERLSEIAIAKRFNLQYPWDEQIKAADYAMGFAEAKQLVPHLGALLDPVEVDTPPLEMWTPDQAYAAFLARFYTLGGEA